jgi:predicted ATPase/DNA-binding CsgD family transcriptional regulator
MRHLPSGSLPEALTSFVGRRREIGRVAAVSASSRLVTLVGPGGVGKSRLAIEAARLRLDQHPDGVWLIDLAGLSDPALIPRALASALSIVEGQRRSLDEALERVLRESNLLLVLDNCEHLIDGCAGLVDRLLHSCPNLRVLATSREPLAIVGEQLVEVSPLPVPAAEGDRDARRLRANEAAQLFAERARAIRPDFVLTEACSEAVAAICRRLDGIPLALELAAARLRTMTLAEIDRGLDDRFRLLSGGGRGRRAEHRTLRGMVDWSWELLNDPQRILLRRLAVFAGGWTREAAQHVCADDTLPRADVAQTLGTLVDRSLVAMDDWRGNARYRLLDTMRAYAGERLRDVDDEAATRRRHQAWYVDLLEAADLDVQRDQLAWLSEMDDEIENVRAALDWCRVEPATTEHVLRASHGALEYWDMRGHVSEARQRFEELLALLPNGSPTAGRMMGEAFFAFTLATGGEFARAVVVLDGALGRLRQVDDPLATFWVECVHLQRLVFSADSSAPSFGLGLLARLRQSPHPVGNAMVPVLVGLAHLVLGNLGEAERMLRCAAETTTEERMRGLVLDALGVTVYRCGDRQGAQDYLRQALAILKVFPDWRSCATTVQHLAFTASALEEWERSARLLGAAEMLFDLSNMAPFPRFGLDPEQIAAICRDRLGEGPFASAFAAGRKMSAERAIQYALTSAPPRRRSPRAVGERCLTRREWEIASLVAEGLSNRRIAETLVIAEKTAESHVSHILAKLGLSSRARLAVWAAKQKSSPSEV